jgi:hypothetical protein
VAAPKHGLIATRRVRDEIMEDGTRS